MRTKETAKQVIDSLPDDATMDDIIHALYINVKFSRGEREIREGKKETGVIHIGFLSSKKISSPDRKVHASIQAVAFRFPSAVCGFAA